MSAQRFKLAIGIAIIATLASLVGVVLNLQRPTTATAASATAATASPSPSPHAADGLVGRSSPVSDSSMAAELARSPASTGARSRCGR